ncbi:N-acetyltransferase [uncultured Jannaschia sp.]|uniref:GNAT family N-acetyltransferase n=1 Tax=uncultured Jannaschia sp. TaxID=293347 RepID=UPI002631B80D|nr:N-acetyltransferase [uncultured Jannaschia sp.]
MLFRPETPEDAGAIRALTTAAFAAAPHSDGTEPAIVDRLRAEGDLILSLLALDGALLGHVAFSPVRLDAPGRWAALGPVSVAPDRQGEGIGTALIESGLARIREAGFAGCVLLGEPDYYGRFGFRNGLGLSYGAVEARYVQGLPFGTVLPRGDVAFAPAFG